MPNPIVNVACPAITISILENDNGVAVTNATWADNGSLDPSDPRSTWPVDPSGFIEGTGNTYWIVGYTFPSAGEWLIKLIANGDATLKATVAITVTDPASDAQPIADAVLAASVTGGAVGSLAYELHALFTKPVVYDGD